MLSFDEASPETMPGRRPIIVESGRCTSIDNRILAAIVACKVTSFMFTFNQT